MCVLLCGVWSLKKARLRCDRLCWWPLNFNTLHNYTRIKIHKVYPSQKWWDITELLVHPASLDMGGAPPHTNHRIRQAARGEGQVGLLKNNAPVANDSLWNMAWLSETWRDSLKHGVTLLNSLGSWLSGTSLFKHRWSCARNFSACSRSYLNFVSTPTKPTIYSKARRHNIKEQRAERLRTKGKLSVTSRGSSHISRVSTREHPETHEPTHVVPEHKDQSNAFEGNKTPSNLLIFNHKQVTLTKSILLIELVESDLNAVTEQ